MIVNLTVGKKYRFISYKFPGKALNIYGSGVSGITSGRNVCLYTDDDTDPMQEWLLKSKNGDLYLCNSTRENFVLDKSSGVSGSPKNNAHICATTQTTIEDYAVVMERVSGDRYVISLKYNNDLCLTAMNGAMPKSGRVSSLNDAGNVCWSTRSGGIEQMWTVEEVGGGSDYPEGYYRFSIDKKYLNGTSSAVTASGTRKGDTTQFWHYLNGKLYVEISPNYGLAGTSNAAMSTSPVNVDLIYDGENKCCIKNGANRYLSISSGTIVWSATKTSWTIERIYKQTGVPLYNPEYFSEKSGLKDGTWNSTWTTNLKKFFAKIYGVSENSVTYNNIGQCMYGAVYSLSTLPDMYRGRFHTGLDFTTGGGSEIKCPFVGKYEGYDENFGCVYVYNETLKCTFVFMHMEPDTEIIKKKEDDIINENEPLGKESNRANGMNIAKHLHIEVWEGKVSRYASLPTYSYEEISTISPYSKIAALV